MRGVSSEVRGVYTPLGGLYNILADNKLATKTKNTPELKDVLQIMRNNSKFSLKTTVVCSGLSTNCSLTSYVYKARTVVNALVITWLTL